MAVAGYPTFPCPSCRQALPATMAAGMVIPCPYCQQRIVVPAGGGPTRAQAAEYQAWHMQHAYTQAAVMDRQAGGGVFPNAATPVPVEAGGAIVVVGPQVDADGRWHLRGVDPATRQVRWEVAHGLPYRTPPEARSICARAGRIYVAHEGTLVAIASPGLAGARSTHEGSAESIDGATARVLWHARLPGRICCDPDAAPVVGDETDLHEVAGVVLVKTEDDVVSAFARETGVPLWQREVDDHPQVAGDALHLRAAFRELDLVTPIDGKTLARFTCTEARLVPGGLVINPDGDGREGVALVDAATGQERWFVAAESITLDHGVAVIGDEVLVPVNGRAGTELLPVSTSGVAPRKGLFARLFGGGPATRALPWSRHNLSAMWALGDALVLDVSSWEGARRIALVDPRTMAVRHDSGVIPDGVAPGVRIGPGLVAYAFGESNGPKTLRMVDTAGRALWERTFDDLDDVAFRAGVLALRTDGGPIELVDIATGQTRCTFSR